MNERKFDLSPFCMRARSFMNQGRTDDALASYDDVLQIDPDNALAHADRGTAYAMLKKFDLARNDLEQAFELGYTEVSAYCTMATVYFETKDFQSALKYFDKAVELDPGYPFTYYNKSNVLHALGDIAGAIAELDKCMRLNPEEGMKQLILRRRNMLQSG